MVRLLLLLPFFLLPLAAFAQPPGPGAPTPSRGDLLPFKTFERTLANGLKVIVVPTSFPNLVSLQIPVQTGSRNEVEPGKSGFAHFFEHMMFRGTKEYPPEVYQAILTRAGARQNAFTTDDFTNYHVTFAREDLETILKIEADRFQNLSYAVEDFKTESRAVLGEYNKNSANPLTKLLEVQRNAGYAVHTYKHTTMGFLKDIEDMPNQYAYSRTFFDRWYRPEYTTLLIAGDVETEKTFALAEKYWGGWKRGNFTLQIPQETAYRGPVYAHHEWAVPTLPWVTVAYHGPAFSETAKDAAAVDMLFRLHFGPTSALYKRLVQDEQKVDQLFAMAPGNADPSLKTVAARLKKGSDAVAVRDAILAAFAESRETPVSAPRLAEAIGNARYALARQMDNTEAIAGTLARYVRYRRSVDTLNNYFRVLDGLTPADLQAAARQYFTQERLVVTTLSKEPLPEGLASPPALVSPAPAGAAAPDFPLVVQKTALPLLNFKLVFQAGSAWDPPGKEGLAGLAAQMITEAGSAGMTQDDIQRALFPLAAGFGPQVDKELVTFTGVVHRDNAARFLDVVLPQLLEPGFRESDFARLKARQKNALEVDLRTNNEEELAKERLQVNLFPGSPYAHPPQGTVAGLEAITLDDVKAFVRDHFTRARLTVGLAGDVPPELQERLLRELSRLPAGSTPPAPAALAGKRPQGMEVEIIRKETRATAISFGLPIAVTRPHPDFPALSVARAWLGEHRSSMARLYNRLREVRGLNYGDYAYIEAFPMGGAQMYPPANVPRRAQIFEVWIRPVAPDNAPMALRIALFELDKLLRDGLAEEDFARVREYLLKNVYLLTATQDAQLGYALDARWYGMGDYAATVREKLAQLTREEVNQAIRRHWSSSDLSVVMVTQEAEKLRGQLLSDEVPPLKYEGTKPQELLEEDQAIAAIKLNLKPEAVKITPVQEVFAR